MDQPIARPPAFDRRSAQARVSAPAAAPGPESVPDPASNSGSAATLRRVSSEELLAGARELEITHGDALYRLRLTALGKLILTK